MSLAEHLRLLRLPEAPLVLDRPATLGDGIAPLPPDRSEDARGRVSSFIPASGAATRMFQGLRQLPPGVTDLEGFASGLSEDPDRRAASRALRGWSDLAIAAALGGSWSPELDLPGVFTALANSGWMDAPKALVPFHLVQGSPRLALEAHLQEAADLGVGPDGRVQVHLTVPQPWRDRFDEVLRELAASVGDSRGVGISGTTSVQDPATDTPAVNLAGELLVRPDGQPWLRPGGHGALLQNLPRESDILLIKNIDNVAHPDHRAQLVGARRRLLSAFLDMEAEHREHVHAARAGGGAEAARRWLRSMGRDGPLDTAFILADLDRPLRVVGVVPNDGQPGGGPFWAEDAEGRVTLQIVESVEVDANNEAQKRLFQSSTHFNPVDLVCRVRDVDGRAHDLGRFVDPRRWIRTVKDHGGQRILCLEYPGLWNGSMAGWLTRFVEMPRETFNPVKSLADLLGERHRPGPHGPVGGR